MLKDAYANGNEIAPNIYEKVFPLPANLVSPLRTYEAPVLIAEEIEELPEEEIVS